MAEVSIAVDSRGRTVIIIDDPAASEYLRNLVEKEMLRTNDTGAKDFVAAFDDARDRGRFVA